MSRLHVIALAAVGLLAAPAGADDDRISWFQESVSLKAGAIFAFVDTDVEVDGNHLDLEHDLNLDDFEVLPSLEARWRFTQNRKHRLEIGYFSILRSGTDTINFDLELPNGPGTT